MILQEEALRRLKLSIDRQLAGEIAAVFPPPPAKLSLLRNVLGPEGEELVVVRTEDGDFIVLEDGSAFMCEIGRVN